MTSLVEGVSRTDAAGVPGRVGEKRMSEDAVALGSNDGGTELTGESPPAITAGETLSESDRGPALVDVPSLRLTVSEGEGAAFFGELQPGFAKISTSAKTWMPTTTLKILRIFIAGIVVGLSE